MLAAFALVPLTEDAETMRVLVTAVATIAVALIGGMVTLITVALQTRRKTAQVEQRLDHEMSPNSGTSARDVLDRLEVHISSIVRRLDRGDRRFDEIAELLDRLTDSDTKQGQAIEALTKPQRRTS